MLNWDEIKDQLKSLELIDTLTKSRNFDVFMKYTNEVYDNFKIWEELHKKLVTLIEKEEMGITKQERALLQLVNIFFLTVSILNHYIDIVIFAVMLKEQCFIIGYEKKCKKKRKISNFDDLKKISLKCRLTFLEEHGFNFFSKICDRDLRNAIAHPSFTIDEGGIVHIKKGWRTEYTISDLIKMRENCDSIIDIVNYYLFGPS